MSAPRFFACGPFGGEYLPLSAEDVHHASTVLRLRTGEEITVVGDDGLARMVTVDTLGRSGISGTVSRIVERPWLPRVTLVTAIGKSDKTDLVVEKAVEIGVEAVVLLETERSVVRLDQARMSRRVERLRRIAASAARQSQRFEIPAVRNVADVAAFAAEAPAYDRVLVAWEEDAGHGIDSALASCAPDDRVAVVVGPEGGLTEAEVAGLASADAAPVTLGPTILRTETAAIVAVALVSGVLGGMGLEHRG